MTSLFEQMPLLCHFHVLSYRPTDATSMACVSRRGRDAVRKWVEARVKESVVYLFLRRAFRDPKNKVGWMIDACSYGHLDVAQRLNPVIGDGPLENILWRRKPRLVCCRSPRWSHLEVVRWALETLPGDGLTLKGVDLLFSACESGDLETVRWIVGEFEITRWPVDHDRAQQSLLFSESLQVVQWVCSHFNLRPRMILDFNDLCADGLLDIAQWMYQEAEKNDRTFILDEWMVSRTAGNGHLNVLQWLLQEELISWDPFILYAACRHGHVNAAEWIWDNDPNVKNVACEPTNLDWTATLEVTCMYGHLEMAQWMNSKVEVDFEIERFIRICEGTVPKTIQWAQTRLSSELSQEDRVKCFGGMCRASDYRDDTTLEDIEWALDHFGVTRENLLASNVMADTKLLIKAGEFLIKRFEITALELWRLRIRVDPERDVSSDSESEDEEDIPIQLEREWKRVVGK